MDGEDGMVEVGMWRGVENGVYLAEVRECLLEMLQQLGINFVGRVFVPSQHFFQRVGHVAVADIPAHGCQRIGHFIICLFFHAATVNNCRGGHL